MADENKALKQIARGPKSSIAQAVTEEKIKSGALVVTTDTQEAVLIERDGSQVVIKAATQAEVAVTDPGLGVTAIPAGTNMDTLAKLVAERKSGDVAVSTVEGNVKVTEADGTTTKDVPVVGALINPVVDEAAHTLTLTKVGAEANEEVVVPLGGACPDTMVSIVEAGEDNLTIKVTTFDKETETESTEVVKIFGAITAVDTTKAGVVATTVQNAAGEDVVTNHALAGTVINAAYDASTKVLTLPVVQAVSEDGTVTTQDITIDFKATVAGAFVDVAHTADTETASAKYDFTYYDAQGAEQTKTVYETGVRKVAAGTSADKVAVTTADTTGAFTTTEFVIGAGNVKNPTYDAETRKITLPVLQADGTTQALEINLGKDEVVTSGVYNEETQEIELTLTSGSVIKIPAAALVDVYTGEATATVTVTVSDTNVITAVVKISTVEKNLLKSDENGLYVVEADFVETKQAIADALDEAKKYADSKDVVWVDFGA